MRTCCVNPFVVLLAVVAGACVALPAEAGDPERGARLFSACAACHSVIDATGRTRVRGGRTGPNLHGVVGRYAGSVPGFPYSPAMAEAGMRGLRWTESDFVAYVRDATAFLRSYLDDRDAFGKMAYRLRAPQEARDIWAYLERSAAPCAR